MPNLTSTCHSSHGESLAADLDDMLIRLEVVDPLPLPVANVTPRPSGIDDVYASEAAHRRAHDLLSPMMDEFGYEVPASWPDSGPKAAGLEHAMGQRVRHRFLAPGR